MKAGEDGSSSPSVSILERALTEVFPGTEVGGHQDLGTDGGHQDHKSSQVDIY